jgi:ABC-type nitrate/sulfonate/bicarbonate transport system permease component
MKKILSNNWAINFISLALIVLSYQTLHIIANEPLVFPSFWKVCVTAYNMIQTKIFWSTFYFTLSTLLYGWLVSSICIIAAVTLCWISPLFRKIFECYCGYFNSLPNFVIIPLLILLFGITNNVMIAVMIFSVFFIMSYQILSAFDAMAVQWGKHVKNLNWNIWQSFRHVYLPASAPILLSMASMSWTYMWRTLISLEVVFGNIGGYMGLGTYIVDVKNTMDIDKMYVVLFVIAITGFSFNSFLNYLSKRFEYK